MSKSEKSWQVSCQIWQVSCQIWQVTCQIWQVSWKNQGETHSSEVRKQKLSEFDNKLLLKILTN